MKHFFFINLLFTLFISSHVEGSPNVTSTPSPLQTQSKATSLHPTTFLKSTDQETTQSNSSNDNDDGFYIFGTHLFKINKRDGISVVHSIFVMVCCLVGFVGNIAVLIIASKHSKNLSDNNIILAQIAATDIFLCIALFSDKFRVFWDNTEWPYGAIMCKVIKSSIFSGELILCGLVFIVNTERFLGIRHPMYAKKMKGRLTRILFPLDILLAGGSVAPVVISYNVSPHNEVCEYNWVWEPFYSYIYVCALIAVYFLIPVGFAFCFFIATTLLLRKESRAIEKRIVTRAKDLRQKRIGDNFRLAYIAGLVMAIFVVSVYPNRLMWAYWEVRRGIFQDYQTFVYVINVAYALQPLHLVVKPIIYCIVDKNWREEMSAVLHFDCRGNDRDEFADANLHLIGRLSSIVDSRR